MLERKGWNECGGNKVSDCLAHLADIDGSPQSGDGLKWGDGDFQHNSETPKIHNTEYTPHKPRPLVDD